MELNVLGRILPQVEQARAQLFAAACLRVDHQFVSVLAVPRHVRHLSPLRRGTRTRHGRGYQEDPVRFTSPLLPYHRHVNYVMAGCISLLCSSFKYR